MPTSGFEPERLDGSRKVVHAATIYFFNVTYVHNPVSTRKINRLDVIKEMVVLENSPEIADSKSKGKNWHTHATYVINSCQGKFAGVSPD